MIFILAILLIIFVYIIVANTYEYMTNIFESVIIPTNCYEYLLTDGNKYYLLNTKQQFNKITNPLIFNTLAQANKYLSDNKCVRLPLIKLINTKHNIPDNYEKKCANEIALNLFNADICTIYTNNDKQIQNYIDSNYAKFNLEECMINDIKKEFTELAS